MDCRADAHFTTPPFNGNGRRKNVKQQHKHMSKVNMWKSEKRERDKLIWCIIEDKLKFKYTKFSGFKENLDDIWNNIVVIMFFLAHVVHFGAKKECVCKRVILWVCLCERVKEREW